MSSESVCSKKEIKYDVYYTGYTRRIVDVLQHLSETDLDELNKNDDKLRADWEKRYNSLKWYEKRKVIQQFTSSSYYDIEIFIPDIDGEDGICKDYDLSYHDAIVNYKMNEWVLVWDTIYGWDHAQNKPNTPEKVLVINPKYKEQAQEVIDTLGATYLEGSVVFLHSAVDRYKALNKFDYCSCLWFNKEHILECDCGTAKMYVLYKEFDAESG